MTSVPTGTVTFLFTDVVGSTALWESEPEQMRVALAAHDLVVRRAVTRFGGHVFSTAGDSFAVAFHRPADAAGAALTVRDALESEDWPGPVRLTLRMGVHSGVADERHGDYFGRDLNRAARLMSAGHGGQILVSSRTADLLSDEQGRDWVWNDLGHHHLRDVSTTTHVFQLDRRGEVRSFPMLRSLEAAAGSLPLQTTRFFGRDEEIAQVSEALAGGERFVTLVGPGGIGKTRLALQVGAQLAGHFGDGVWFVPLAPLTDTRMDAVTYAVAEVLGVTAAAGQPMTGRLIGALQQSVALLILDNCEHVGDGVRALIRELQRSCLTIEILATSREALGLEGERVLPVRPLDRSETASVDIFVDRARLAGANLQDGDMAAVHSVCGRLDGIPLAIELAAARCRSTSPVELLSRLDNQMRVLAGRPRHGDRVDTRHLTMRQTIDWSYGLLEVGERWLFDRLSVFSGTFDFDAVRSVVGTDDVDEFDLIDLVDALVDRSMLVPERQGELTRYRLLEPLRQFAASQLNDETELSVLRHRHLVHFTEFVRVADAAIQGPGMGEWMAATNDAVANIRAAHQFALEIGDLDRAVLLATRPRLYWWERIGGEQLEWMRTTETALVAARHPQLPHLRAHLASAVGQLVDASEGVEIAVTAIDALPAGRDRQIALGAAFLFSAAAGRTQDALYWSERLLTDCAATPVDDYSVAEAQLGRALALWGVDRTAAQVSAARALELARRVGNESMLAFVLSNGLAARSVAEAIEQCNEAIVLADRAGLTQSRGVALYMRAEYLTRLPESSYDEVFTSMLDALDAMQRAGARLQLMMVIEYAARALAHRGHPEVAAQVFGAQQTSDLLPIQAVAGGGRRHRAIAAAEAELGADYQRFEERGRALDLAGVIDLVRSTLTGGR